MIILYLVIFAVLPAILWLIFVYKQDKFEPEPKVIITITFVLGVISAFIALMISNLYSENSFITFSVEVPVVEEFLKFFCVFPIIYRHKQFNEPIDGIIYSSSAAMGFAAAENILYINMAYYNNIVVETIIFRAIVSVPAHFLISSFWGYSLGLARFKKDISIKIIMVSAGLFLAILTHAIFNFFALINLIPTTLITIFIALLWYIFQERIKALLNKSPFKVKI